nr:suppressor of fused domain protein [Sphingomonas sp. RIT328]
MHAPLSAAGAQTLWSSLPFGFDGNPLDGISAWKSAEPIPHWHCVGFGLSELYWKESDDEAISGHGFELTFRLRCDPADEDPPGWRSA